MKAHFSLTRRDVNVIIACLLSFSIFMMPFVPIAAATGRSERRVSPNKPSQSGQVVTVNAPLPAPAPMVATVTATKSAAILNDDGDLKADPTNGVPGTTEKIEYTVTISNTGNTDATNVTFTDTIDAHTTLVGGSITTQPIAVNDTYSSIGNVGINVPDGATDLLGNDCDPDPLGGACTNAGLTISVLAGDNTGPNFAGTSANGGNVTASATDGSFAYSPAPGFEGSDSFTYTTVDATGKTDTATVNITVSGMIWFVNAAAPAGGDGRLLTPFNCLVGPGSCFSGTTADEPGDFIFLFSGTYNDNAALVLLNNQKVIGAAATAALAGPGSITNFTIPTHSNTLPLTNQASPVINSTASGIQLASGNLLRGFTVGNTSTSVGNYDILNTATATVGTLTILEVILNGTGGLLRVDSGGALSVSFPTATTTSAGSNGLHIAGVTTGSVSIAGGAITVVAGADVAINGGQVALSCAAGITHAAGVNPMVSISGGHSVGIVTFTGALNASSGTGLQFDNADSTYNFNGTTTLAGGDAGIDVLNGSAGTFNFGGTTITNPSGVALNVSASSGAISISGAISKNTDGKMIDFDNYDGGTATISGNLSCTSICDGVEVTNDGSGSGTVTFSAATKTLNTSTSTAVNIDNIDGGTVNFNGGGLDIDTTSGVGFNAINGGTVNVTTGTNNNTIDTDTGTAVNITGGTNIGANGMTLFSLTVDNGVSNSAANAIVLNGTTGAFMVTGDGSQTAGLFDRDGSGGTINRTTGHSVNLTNAQNVTLRQMNITNTQGSGAGCPGACTSNMVNSSGGSNIVLSAILFQNPSGHGWYGLNLGGISKFDNNGRVQNWQTNNATGITIDNTNTNFTSFDVRNSVFTTSATGADGFLFDVNGASSGTVNVISNEFTLIDQDAIQINNDGSGTLTAIVQKNNCHDSDATSGDGNNTLFMALSGTGNLNFTIGGPTAADGNTFTNTSRLQALAGIIQVNAAGGLSSIGALNGSIQNNTITNPGFVAARRGIMIAAEASAGNQGAHSVLIANNSVQSLTIQGIYVSITSLNGWDILNSNFSINNNQVGNIGAIGTGGGDGGSAIEYETNPAAANTSTNFSGNLLIQGNTAVSNNNSAAGSTLEINNRHTGGNNTSVLNVVVKGNSLSQGNAAGEAFELLNSSGDGTGAGPSTCLDLNSANIVADRNNAIGTAGAGAFRLTNNLGIFQIESMGASTPSAFLGPRNLTNGVSPATITAAGAGAFTSSAGCTDSTAAPTFFSSSEAVLRTPKRPTAPSTVAVNPQSDVKSVQTAGLPSSNSALKTSVPSKRSAGTTLSYAAPSTSRFLATPSAPQAAPKRATLKSAPAATAVAPTMAGETVGPIIIGTLRPGDSVTLTFQVTVNNPPALSQITPPQVSNFGTVNFNDGATPLNVNTNTVNTPVDRFDSQTTLISDLNPANQGDTINFTATVAIHPSQTPTPPSPVTPTGTVTFKSDGVDIAGCVNVALNGSAQAVCTTNALTPPSHNITAVYSGDGNYDPSTSGAVAQVIIACLTNPVVTSTADDGSAGTLRHTIANVCNNNTITFDLPGGGPHTITLLTGEIPVAKNVTIKNTSGERITVSGNNNGRVFNINAGFTVAITGLTLSGGSVTGNGGAVINNGSLTLVNSTLSGNTATGDGGGIANSATATSLTLINTTISGNTATVNGGGLAVLGGTATSINGTITNNSADSDNNGSGAGGGISAAAGTTTLKNTIVAGNFNEDGGSDAADDISGTVDAASSFNLIGTGGAGGLTNGVNNNQVGVANAGLGALADNGGLVNTHALSGTSAAVETGSNANLPADTFDLDGDLNTAEALPVDGRGLGFPRTADSQDVNLTQTVDIGAFELHPSIEDIANQSTNEDTAANVPFNIGDDTGSLIATVVATSSNTTLVPNANLNITGSGGSRNLQATPAPNQSGVTTITVTVTATNGRTATDTFDLTVNAVNDPPAGTDNTVSTAEDTTYTFTAADFGFTDPNDTPPNTFLAVKITTLPGLGTLTNNNVPVNAGDFISVADINGGLLKFTPAPNGFGTPYTSFTFQVQDAGGGTDLDPTPNTMTINVTGVNDGPVNTVPGAQSTDEDVALVFSSGNANQISVADSDAGANPIKITLTATNGTISLSTTAGLSFITGDGTADATMMFTGTLTAVNTALNGMSFTGTANFSGAASLQIVSDDQGNTGTGGPLTDTDSVNITVNALNDPPSGTDNTVSTAEDTAYTFTAADFGFSDPNDTPPNTLQAVKITTLPGLGTLTNNNVAVVAGNFIPVADINGGLLKFTPAADGNGTPYTTFTFQVQDNGGGSDLDPTPNTMTINVTAVNDGPVNTVPGPQSTTEDTPKVFSSGTANQISVADVDAGSNPVKITLTATNGTITLSTTAGLSFITGDGTADATMMFTGTLTAVNTAMNGMTFTPTLDFTGAASLQIVSDDQGNTGSGGPLTDTDTVNITVNAANDPPIVTTTAGNLLYTENDSPTAIDTGLTVTDVDSANLAGATVAITAGFVAGQDTLGFTNQNGISGIYNSGTGVLTLTGSSSVANYQTALRSVTYSNSSDNPTASRTVTFIADDGSSTSAPATRGIAITAVNDAPVNTVPGAQSTNENTPLTFSGGNGNQISVNDVDAGTNAIQVTLTATNGTLTLSGTSGLSFTVGDGTADATMTFTGTITNINAALNGMTFTPTLGFNGAATLTITSNDLGNSGTGGPLSDTDVINIQVATNVSIQDAQVAEPKSGSVNMVFTVTLSAPAPAGGSSVAFTTVQLAPALNHATAGDDYTTTSGTVNFAAGEQFKTILVPVLSDNKKSEANESFEVQLSSPVNLTIADGTATGTIIENEQAGAVLISELRTSGPAGAGDDFVEIYNNSNAAITVNTPGGGFGLFKMGASCSDAPVLLGVVPNGTVIPARGHFLFTGSAYSLADYGGTGSATGDVIMSSDIESDRNVALFGATTVGTISSANRLDAVGFGANTGGTCDLFREGTTLIPTAGSVLEYTYFRDECGKKGNPSTFGPCPTGGLTQDSNVNRDDFIFADTTAANTPAGRRLGAPGPQNLGSPRQTFDVLALLIDSSKSASGTPNRVRDTSAMGPNAAEGTLSIRRRFQNNTGAPVQRLRIRVVDISTTFVSGGVADLRLLSSSNVTVSVNDAATCTAAGFASAPCNITVFGTTLETPPNQPLGGGFNSSATTGVITLGSPLANGASINLQLLLGVQNSGSFKFFFNIEALP